MRDLELEIISRLTEELDRFGPSLSASGLCVRAPEIEISREHPDEYTSEIRLTILKDGQIDDVLEFHIFRDGVAVVTGDEATQWYRSELAKLCAFESS
jgi:hypothetical protein